MITLFYPIFRRNSGQIAPRINYGSAYEFTTYSFSNTSSQTLPYVYEFEIKKFVPKEYWSIFGIFSKPSGNSKPFNAKLYKINDDIIKYNGEEPCIHNIDEAHNVIEELKNNKYKISDIQVREVKRNAPLPFTTSVLQQTASTKLGMAPKRTMQLAQGRKTNLSRFTLKLHMRL